jgi:hypothetical protein
MAAREPEPTKAQIPTYQLSKNRATVVIAKQAATEFILFNRHSSAITYARQTNEVHQLTLG